MPYHIVLFDDGYRVVSDTGRILSHKPLSYDQAQKQMVAVSISEGIFPSQLKGEGKASQPSTAFASQLKGVGLTPSKYLAQARRVAKRMNYNPRLLVFSDNSTHKLQITNPEGKIRRFGRVGYGDFIIWSHREKAGDVPKGYADKKRDTFRKSHIAMSKKFGITDEYAPNNLAINILW